MLRPDDLLWLDFETKGEADLKGVGTFAYVTAAEAIVCAYAVGHAPAQVWHQDGGILDWDRAPRDLHDAYERGLTLAAWNAAFDGAVWNYATLGFPFLEPRRIIDPMLQAGCSNLPTDLESASRYLGGPG